jgi:polysaccharide biosynthesis protein PslJ
MAVVHSRQRRRKVDAVGMLTAYVVLLLAIPATLVFAPLGAAGGPSTLFAVLLFVVYLTTWLHPRSTLDRDYQPIRLVALVFVCVIVASYASANRHAMPVLERNAADRALLFTFGWFGLMAIAADGISSMERLATLLRRIVTGVSLIATLGAVQFFTGLDATKYLKVPGLSALSQASDLLSRGTFFRPSSTASHPIEFGAVLAICLPLAIHQARFSAPDKKLFNWLQVAVIAVTAPMTVSRSAILGLILAAVILLPTWPKQERRLAYVAVVFFVTMMWLTVHGLVGTISGLFLSIGSDSSTLSRTNALAAAGQYVAQHPWLGRGPSTFLPATYFYIDDQYLTSLIETGILGALSLIAVFLTGWLVARNTRRLNSDPEARHLAQCFAACSAVAAVSFFTYDALSFPMASGLTFLIIGCAGAFWRLTVRGHQGDLPVVRASRASMSVR